MEPDKKKRKEDTNISDSSSSSEEEVSKSKNVPQKSASKTLKPGSKRPLTTHDSSTDVDRIASISIPNISETDRGHISQKSYAKSDHDVSRISRSSRRTETTDVASASSRNEIHRTPSTHHLKDRSAEDLTKDKDLSPRETKILEPVSLRSRSMFTIDTVKSRTTSAATHDSSPTIPVPIVTAPKMSQSQRDTRFTPPLTISTVQDAIIPNKSLKSDTMLLNKDRSSAQADPSTTLQNPPVSLTDSSPSRTISLERVSSRLDVRVSTQTEGATSQGDVLTTRTMDTDASTRTGTTRSAGIVTTTSISPTDTSTKPSSTTRESKSITVTVPESTVKSPESVHTTRSILRRGDTLGETFIESNMPSQASSPVQKSHHHIVLPDQDRSAMKTFSKITFPSLPSSEDSNLGTNLKAERSLIRKGPDPTIVSRMSSRSTFTEFSGYSTSAPTLVTFVDDLDDAHQRIGGNSWRTWRILIAASAPGFVNMWLLVSTVLMTSLVRFRCKIDSLDEEKWSDRHQRELIGARFDENVCFIPNVDYMKISRMTLDEAWPVARKANIDRHLVACTEYVFETGNTTLVAEFKLVCERRDLLVLYQVVAGVGMSVGALCFGALCDHIGRRSVFIVSLVMYTLCFPMSVIIPDYWALTVSHFLCGIANSGCFISAIVLMIEWARVSNRPVIGVMMFFPWGMGLTFIALVAFYITEWWYLQITIAIPASLLLVCAFVLPESPRWLYAVGKRAKAWNTIRKVFREVRPLETATDDFQSQSFDQRLNVSMRYWGYLGSKRELRWRLLICMLACFAAGAVYYLVILRAGAYGILVHFILALCGVLEMVACGLTIVFLSVFGPRPTNSILFLVCGACISFSTFVPPNITAVVLFLLIFARVIACILFFSQIIQTCELFPTLVRGTALGIALMFTYVFGFVVPLVVVGCTTDVNQNAVKNCYCVFAVVCGVLVLLLPCTRRRFLTNTMEDVNLEAARGIEVTCRNLYWRE